MNCIAQTHDCLKRSKLESLLWSDSEAARIAMLKAFRHGRVFDFGLQTRTVLLEDYTSHIDDLAAGRLQHPFDLDLWVLHTRAKHAPEEDVHFDVNLLVAPNCYGGTNTVHLDVYLLHPNGARLICLGRAMLEPTEGRQAFRALLPLAPSKTDPQVLDEQRGTADWACRLLLDGLATLAALQPGMVETVVTAPLRTQLSNRPLTYKTISRDAYKTVLRSPVLPLLARADHGGTHASPAPHERRGHWRQITPTKQVWVRAARVNCRAGDEPLSRTHYELRP